MHIGPKTKLDELLCAYPFLKDFLVRMDPHFKTLDNPLLRRTLGRVATLSRVAMVGWIELNKLMDDIAGETARPEGEGVAVEREEHPEIITGSEQRIEALKEIIKDLHKG